MLLLFNLKSHRSLLSKSYIYFTVYPETLLCFLHLSLISLSVRTLFFPLLYFCSIVIGRQTFYFRINCKDIASLNIKASLTKMLSHHCSFYFKFFNHFFFLCSHYFLTVVSKFPIAFCLYCSHWHISKLLTFWSIFVVSSYCALSY
jgi:hypothetical protein